MFSDALSAYMNLLECSGKELAEASGLAAAVVSRYKTGARVPLAGGEHFVRLVKGLALLAAQRGMDDLSETSLSQSLVRSSVEDNIDPQSFSAKFDFLISSLGINASVLARQLNFDPSYVSRIRTGKRTPAYPQVFARQVARYVVATATDEAAMGVLSDAVSCSLAEGTDARVRERIIAEWLCDPLEDDAVKAHRHGSAAPLGPVADAPYVCYPTLREACDAFVVHLEASCDNGHIIVLNEIDEADLVYDETDAHAWIDFLETLHAASHDVDVLAPLSHVASYATLLFGSSDFLTLLRSVRLRYAQCDVDHSLAQLVFLAPNCVMRGERVPDADGGLRYSVSTDAVEVSLQRGALERMLKKSRPMVETFDFVTSDDLRKRIEARRFGAGRDVLAMGTPSLYMFPQAVDPSTILGAGNVYGGRMTERCGALRGIVDAFASSNLDVVIIQLTEQQFFNLRALLLDEGHALEQFINNDYAAYCDSIDAVVRHCGYGSGIKVRMGRAEFQSFDRSVVFARQGSFVVLWDPRMECRSLYSECPPFIDACIGAIGNLVKAKGERE